MRMRQLSSFTFYVGISLLSWISSSLRLITGTDTFSRFRKFFYWSRPNYSLMHTTEGSVFLNNMENLLTDTSEVFVLILCGIPGCGKSTLAANLLNEVQTNDAISNKRWKILCQDVLGNRLRVLKTAKTCLNSNCNVIIDRCNFDVSQRAHWIQLAKEFRAKSICIVLPQATALDICIERAIARGNDGIHDINTNWCEVCGRMWRQYVPPTLAEGMDSILVYNSTIEIKTMLQNISLSI